MAGETKNDWIKLFELAVVTVGIAVSVFALFEIKEQSRQNAEQIAVLKNNSDLNNRLTIFREFYPKYSIVEEEKVSHGTRVSTSFSITNQSDSPIAYDEYFIYRFTNCGTGEVVNLGEISNITKDRVEKSLRDNRYYSIAPNQKKEITFTLDIAKEDNVMRVAKITDATFLLNLVTFVRLENIEHFEDFVDTVGFDFSDSFKINDEFASLPPNTKNEHFSIPVRWNEERFEIMGSDTCKAE